MVNSDLKIVLVKNDLITIKVYTFIVISENVVIIIDTGTKECFDNLYKELKKINNLHKYEYKYLLNTHFHSDHIGSNSLLKEKFKILTIGSEINNYFLSKYNNYFEHVSNLLSGGYAGYINDFKELFLREVGHSYDTDIIFSQKFKLKIGKRYIESVETSGHTVSDFCFKDNMNEFIIIGDSLSPLETNWMIYYENVKKYLMSLNNIKNMVKKFGIKNIYTTHYGKISPDLLFKKINESKKYCNNINRILLENKNNWNDLDYLAKVVCNSLGKIINLLSYVSLKSHLSFLKEDKEIF